MQSKFSRRMHKGLQFQVNYTLAEARANYGDLAQRRRLRSGFRGYDLNGWGGLDNEWGLADFHTKHALVFSGIWELPGKGAILGGWSVQLGAVDLQRPAADDRLHAGHRLGRRLRRPARRRSVRRRRHDIDAVLQPGRVPRSGARHHHRADRPSPAGRRRGRQVTGPPFRQLDMGVAKQFRVWGERQFELRAEAFNVTNTASFNLPGSLNFLDARNFSSITSMRNTPRQIQLGLKFYW